MMGWSTSGPQLNLDNWTRHRNRGWGLGERGVGEDTVFVLDTLSYTSIVFHKFFKLKINIKETHYYSDASHVPRAWAGSESYHSPQPFFIILSLYTISSQPDDDLHSPWDPFHQDVNRGLPPILKQQTPTSSEAFAFSSLSQLNFRKELLDLISSISLSPTIPWPSPFRLLSSSLLPSKQMFF